MARRSPRVSQAVGLAVVALLVAILPAATLGGEAPGLTIRPTPRPDPQATWREERRDDAAARRAFEAGRREDMQDWLWGGSLQEWLDTRGAAERGRAETRRERSLERQRVRPDTDVRDLGRRLDDQWQRQWDLQRDRRGGRSPGISGNARPLRR